MVSPWLRFNKCPLHFSPSPEAVNCILSDDLPLLRKNDTPQFSPLWIWWHFLQGHMCLRRSFTLKNNKEPPTAYDFRSAKSSVCFRHLSCGPLHSWKISPSQAFLWVMTLAPEGSVKVWWSLLCPSLFIHALAWISQVNTLQDKTMGAVHFQKGEQLKSHSVRRSSDGLQRLGATQVGPGSTLSVFPICPGTCSVGRSRARAGSASLSRIGGSTVESGSPPCGHHAWISVGSRGCSSCQCHLIRSKVKSIKSRVSSMWSGSQKEWRAWEKQEEKLGRVEYLNNH